MLDDEETIHCATLGQNAKGEWYADFKAAKAWMDFSAKELRQIAAEMDAIGVEQPPKPESALARFLNWLKFSPRGTTNVERNI